MLSVYFLIVFFKLSLSVDIYSVDSRLVPPLHGWKVIIDVA
jgi:hypothetical protein